MLKILYLIPAPLIPIKLTFPVFPAWLHFGHSQQFGSSSLTTPSDSFTCGRHTAIHNCAAQACRKVRIIPRHPVQLLVFWDGLQPPQGSRGTVLPVLSKPWVLHSHPSGRKGCWPNTSDTGLSSGLSIRSVTIPIYTHTALRTRENTPRAQATPKTQGCHCPMSKHPPTPQVCKAQSCVPPGEEPYPSTGSPILVLTYINTMGIFSKHSTLHCNQVFLKILFFQDQN